MLYIYLFFKIPEKKVWILITLDFIQPGWMKFCDKKKYRNQMSNLPIICTNT